VNAAKPARAATLPRVFWSLPDLRRWALRSGVFALCLAATLMLTALRLEITRLRYELSARDRGSGGPGANRRESQSARAGLPGPGPHGRAR
jgi:hypothetical protein